MLGHFSLKCGAVLRKVCFSVVGHSDCGTQMSRKVMQSTEATMSGEIQDFFTSNSHVLLGAEPLEPCIDLPIRI